MARTKTPPVKSAQKRTNERKSLREKRKSSSIGAELRSPPSKKSLRLATQGGRKRSTSKKTTKGKDKPALRSDSNLPPELRQAGLVAHQSMAKGKCFGPFRGQVVHKKRSPGDKHSLVCKVGSEDCLNYYFYVHDDDKDQCMWLQRMQIAASAKEQNMVAHNSAVGVCYEAMNDISVGEELLVLFDDTYGGKKYPAYVENIPIQFVPQSEKGQLTVLSLGDTEGNNSSPGPSSDMLKDNKEDEAAASDANEHDEGSRENTSQDSSPLENDEVNVEEHDNYYPEFDEEEDEEYSEECDTSDDAEWKQKNSRASGKKKKILLKINEIKCSNLENNTETTKYQCSYCATENDSHEAAQQHVTSRECCSLVFSCITGCGRIFQNKQSQQKHKCTGNPICGVCDEVMVDWKHLERHMRQQRKNEDHKIRCKECDIEFADRNEKRRHIRSEHRVAAHEPIACPVCLKMYNKSYLKDHMLTHEPEGLKCPECNKKFSSSSNLRKHVRKHSPDYKPALDKRRMEPREKKHECMDCQKRFDTPHALEVHSRTHTGERPFQCEYCEWKFSQKPHLTRHLKTVHKSQTQEGDDEAGKKPPPPAELPKICEECLKVYANARVLRVHIQTVHKKERPHKCCYCEATFTQRGHLWRHKHTVHPDSEEVQKKISSGTYTCSTEGCGMAFPCQSELTNHMASKHLSSWPYVCDRCGATFVNRGNMDKHFNKRHKTADGLDKFTCDTCNKDFDTLYRHTQHKRTHSGEKGFQCDLCGQGFVQRSGLNKHIRCKRCPKLEESSIKTIKFKCDVCERMFPGPSDLKCHMRTHTGEKPYECHVCKKTFSQMGNLTKHIKYVHEKLKRPKDRPREKRFYCSLCGMAFACPSSLTMHCRTHSGDKPFICEQCSLGFVQLGNLKKHLKRWHGPDGTLQKTKRKRKGDMKKQENPEGLDDSRLENEAADQKEASTSQDTTNNEENNPSHESDVEDVSSGEEEVAEAEVRVEQASVVPNMATVTSSQEIFVNSRGCTPLNTASQGYHITPLNSAISNSAHHRAPIIMSHFVSTGSPMPNQQGLLSHIPQSIGQQCLTTQAPIFVPGPYGTMTSPNPQDRTRHLGPQAQARNEIDDRGLGQTQDTTIQITSANTAGTGIGTVPNTSVILPHMHTILTQQMPPAPFVSPAVLMGQLGQMGHMGHGAPTDLTIFPFSPSTLFQQ